MPSKSKAQRNLMAAAAHNPAFAKKVGVPVSVAQEFNQADKGKKFKGGGMAKSDMKEDTKMDMAQDKAMIKKAMKQHDMQEHKGGKGTKLSLKKGGITSYTLDNGTKVTSGGTDLMGRTFGQKGYVPTPVYKKGGSCDAKKYARGGGIEVRGKTKGRII